MKWFMLFSLLVVASPLVGQEAEPQKRNAQAIQSLYDEVKELRKEVALLRQLLEKILASQPAVTTPAETKPATRRVWKQVRPHMQIEGMIDDGYEWVEEPIEPGEKVFSKKPYYLKKY